MANSFSLTELVVALVGAGGVTQIGNIVANRTRAHAYAQGAVDRAMKSRDEALARADARADRFELRLDATEAQREQCETELRGVNQRLDEALHEIERLMAGPIADYNPRIPE